MLFQSKIAMLLNKKVHKKIYNCETFALQFTFIKAYQFWHNHFLIKLNKLWDYFLF